MKSKKITKQRLGEGIVNMIHAKESGQKFKPGRKDGGIATKPVVPVDKTKPEAVVLKECISWLKRHRVGAKRMNVTAIDMDGHGTRRYGIKGAGDILCVYAGLYIEVEAKRGKGGVWSQNQQDHCHWVRDHGGTYLIVHGVEELEFFLSPLLKFERHQDGL